MIIRLPIQVGEKKPLQQFKINQEYKTKTKITRRTIEVGEAYGIGVDDEKTFAVFRNFVVEVNPGQIVLITGDSGSGKSTLLREISAQLPKDFGRIVTNDEVKPDDDELIIEGVGRDMNQAISVLSMAGLSEAFLMLRKFSELSDGQKYRYRVAKMIDSSAGTWVFDEFAAVLDRITAKVISFTVQKTARKLGKTLIVATTHEDLLQDIKPDIWIHKEFGESVKVTLYEKSSFDKECSILKDVRITPCKVSEIGELEKFHYRGKVNNLVKHAFKATLGDSETPIATIVFVCPHLALKARSIALPQFRGRVNSDMARLVNKYILRIARVIVLPKFRSIGLGAEIVRRTMPLVDIKFVETLAAMAKYNPFFEKAGMTRVDVPDEAKLERDLQALESLGFKRELLPSRSHVEKVLSTIRNIEQDRDRAEILPQLLRHGKVATGFTNSSRQTGR